METLSKTIKKLTEDEYQKLLSAVAGRKNNKPYIVIEAARHHNYDEQGMMSMLGVNPSAYYTLKNRLNEKIAAYLSQHIDNPISALKEKVARVPALLFGSDREVSIRSLKNLEKELIEYDLSNELITVYKALARLSIYNGDYDFYEKEYNRHVAFSLSVVKAEDLFFEFNRRAGQFLLSNEESDFENLQAVMRELTNIAELYHGHRLFVLLNVVRTYFLCIHTTRRENLAALELEIDNILQQIRKHFETYQQDTFYQSIRFIPDFLYFQYYTKTGNMVRADHHYQRINNGVADISSKPIFGFYLSQYLQSKIDRYMINGDLQAFCDLNAELETSFETEINDPYPYITKQKFLAICKFYQGDFAASAKIINKMRNDISLKKFFHTDVECKFFQALNYCLIGEDGLCTQLLQSLKRQLTGDKEENGETENGGNGDTTSDSATQSIADSPYGSAFVFMALLKAAIKPDEFRKKVTRLTEVYEEFNTVNTGSKKILSFLKLDESTIRRMANPIKE